VKPRALQEARPEFISAVIHDGGRPIGRTAVMKFSYLLQTLRKVPLSYRFSLCTYGPFDHEVLSDLTQAENQRLVKSTLVAFPSGSYGYEIEAKAQKARGITERYRDDIRWVWDRFGTYSASELEMASTIVFVDRSVKQRNEKIGLPELVRKVEESSRILRKSASSERRRVSRMKACCFRSLEQLSKSFSVRRTGLALLAASIVEAILRGVNQALALERLCGREGAARLPRGLLADLW
jgi:hypothetical protein